ncbi:hypothetical protein DFH06DRAFT_1139352 [Mycena polygramma]|nr:hypothetical protein DFH06DRAFT_1139352 [Mycena polygramma]
MQVRIGTDTAEEYQLRLDHRLRRHFERSDKPMWMLKREKRRFAISSVRVTNLSLLASEHLFNQDRATWAAPRRMAREGDGQRWEEEKGEGVVWVCGRLGRSGRLDFAGQRERAANPGSGKGTRQRPNLRAWATEGPEGRPKATQAERSSQGRRPARGRPDGPEDPTQEQGRQREKKEGKRRGEKEAKLTHVSMQYVNIGGVTRTQEDVPTNTDELHGMPRIAAKEEDGNAPKENMRKEGCGGG